MKEIHVLENNICLPSPNNNNIYWKLAQPMDQNYFIK